MFRACGQDPGDAWVVAADGWRALGRRLPAAIALWRGAEACLSRGRRDQAAEAAGGALAAAREIGAVWLVTELEGLIARARLSVDAEAGADVGVGSSSGDGAPGDDDDPFGLTPRERQVLALVARGATNREIGAELFMAEKTASVHVSRILAKLDVRSRTEAAAVAHRLGLVAD
jgi:DNA-binding NarL/FixJ family response regulator